ncbi:MAG: TonB-dependent receptor [Pseudomonadota bacterium]
MSGIFGGVGRHLMKSTALICCMTAAPALAQTATFDVPTLPAGTGIATFGRQADIQLLISERDARGKRTNAIKGAMTVEQGLTRLLAGTGLSYRRNGPQTYVVTTTSVSGASEPARDDPGPDIIVTAQKREEKIQDVPIAISAFSGKLLDSYKIESGGELLKAVPNVTFSKNNFIGYNFSIRGIGTKAVSVTTDPSVAISYNNTPLIRNRLYEQEYFDVERVEVLRGPQGTLYGRNATGGVVNMITNKARTDRFDGSIKGEVGNFGTRRLSGFINVPITDTLAVRAAGAATKRTGFDYNSVTDHNVNGRDLWSGRISAHWAPTNGIKLDFIWEHFDEKDDRSRTGKQLCTRDSGPESVAGVDISADPVLRGIFSQGCKSASIFNDAAYGTPNGLSLPLIIAAAGFVELGFSPGDGKVVTLLKMDVDPYGGLMQSRDLREIASSYDPKFRAKNDIFQLDAQMEISSGLTIFSQTAYTKDSYYSSQDYNRFTTLPIFSNSSGLVNIFGDPIAAPGLSPGGIYTDPQLGPSNTILAVDINQARSTQWSQEFRLQSDFTGPINFSLGANYQKFETREDYYVLFNLASAIAEGLFNGGNGIRDGGKVMDCAIGQSDCVYIDHHPIDQIDGQGHNYFRSSNPYSFTSKAAFGEVYWQVAPNIKITGGLRYTDDRKSATPVPSQLLLLPGAAGGGYVNSGYPENTPIKQNWQAVTGKFGVDWKPQLGFTDQTLLYATYSRGYKGGGANPPGIGSNPQYLAFLPQPTTFRPEYINAFEIGTKNTLFGGTLTLNASAFYYDYKDYQISKIVDRTALNENINATVWGLELEGLFRPSRAFTVNFNLGYLRTRVGKGARSIDVMNRTQGNADYTLVKPWVQLASNCVVPTKNVKQVLNGPIPALYQLGLVALCGGSRFGDYKPGSFLAGVFGFTFDPLTEAPNQGQGFYADLGGKELPNSPHLTANIGAQYTLSLGDWDVALRGDYYRQGKSFARVYNTEYDRLKGWGNANLSLTVAKPGDDLAIQLYVKNVFDDTPITDAFTNSDDSGLTTNVFTLDPRIVGLSLTKGF